MDHRALVVIRC